MKAYEKMAFRVLVWILLAVGIILISQVLFLGVKEAGNIGVMVFLGGGFVSVMIAMVLLSIIYFGGMLTRSLEALVGEVNRLTDLIEKFENDMARHDHGLAKTTPPVEEKKVEKE